MWNRLAWYRTISWGCTTKSKWTSSVISSINMTEIFVSDERTDYRATKIKMIWIFWLFTCTIGIFNYDFFSKKFHNSECRFNEYYIKYPGFVGCVVCYFQNYWKKGCFWQKYPNFNCFYMSGTNDFLMNWSIYALGIV